MNKIEKYVGNLEIGGIQAYKNMVVAPLMGKDSGLNYLLLDEALGKGLTIDEVSQSGSVPHLHFQNKTGQRILMMQGQYVQGGKQNRMLATNVYMEEGFKGNVPVHCIQQGRWNHGGAAPKEGAGSFSKGKMVGKTIMSCSLRGQGDVWRGVNDISEIVGAFSDSQDFGEVQEKIQDRTASYKGFFNYTPGSVGIIVVSEKEGKQIIGADIYDQSSTLQKNFDDLIEAYAVNAIAHDKDMAFVPESIHRFKEDLAKIQGIKRLPVSLGKDYHLNSESIEGLALTFEKTPLVISVNGKEKRQIGQSEPRPELLRTFENVPKRSPRF